MTTEFTHNGINYWITVEKGFNIETGSEIGYAAYVNTKQPGTILGMPVKDENGLIRFFRNSEEALEAAKEQIKSKKIIIKLKNMEFTKVVSQLVFSINNVKESITGAELDWKRENFQIQTEFLNPYRCEGYATIWIQVDGNRYQRTFEVEVPDIRIANFITKFINDKGYREQFKNKTRSSIPTAGQD